MLNVLNRSSSENRSPTAPAALTWAVSRTGSCCSSGWPRRRKLYFPALVATSKNPDIKALYERLLAVDKTKMCALGAAMRKLVHICYGVVKNQTP